MRKENIRERMKEENIREKEYMKEKESRLVILALNNRKYFLKKYLSSNTDSKSIYFRNKIDNANTNEQLDEIVREINKYYTDFNEMFIFMKKEISVYIIIGFIIIFILFFLLNIGAIIYGLFILIAFHYGAYHERKRIKYKKKYYLSELIKNSLL